jgi:hypothetical protein
VRQVEELSISVAADEELEDIGAGEGGVGVFGRSIGFIANVERVSSS